MTLENPQTKFISRLPAVGCSPSKEELHKEEAKENTQPADMGAEEKEDRAREGREGNKEEGEKRQNLPDCPFCSKDFR